MKEYQEIVETNKEKVATFETMVDSYEAERSKIQKVRQDNIKLLMELKESHEVCKELIEKFNALKMNSCSRKDCILIPNEA